MLHRLHVSVDGTSQAIVDAGLEVAVEAGRLNVRLLRVQHKEVRFGGAGNVVELVQNVTLELLRGPVKDQIRVDVDER